MVDVLLLDVFTDRAYAGNPLAVVFDSDLLDPRSMQTIANELNLSETVFLRARRPDGAWPTRIFTPRLELPFAGHPTVGAGVALAATGRVPLVDGGGSCVLAEAVGPVAVDLRSVSPGPPGAAEGSATLQVPRKPVRVRGVDPRSAAAMVGVAVEHLDDEVEPAVWSAGVEFVVVVARSVDVVSLAAPSPDAEHVYVLAPIDGTPGSASMWRARMFAPAMGITEDPATGAAAAATAGLLAELDTTREPTRSWTIEQGVEMGRPSRIEVTVRRTSGGELDAVLVGGRALIVGSSSLIVPYPEMEAPP
jgi:trans-2,3-dihydro-3-hydroxyanthranilate isomerase